MMMMMRSSSSSGLGVKRDVGSKGSCGAAPQLPQQRLQLPSCPDCPLDLEGVCVCRIGFGSLPALAGGSSAFHRPVANVSGGFVRPGCSLMHGVVLIRRT